MTEQVTDSPDGERSARDDPGGFERWRRETRDALRTATSARIDVYVRSLLPPPGAKEAQNETLARLREAVEAGPVADPSVHVWGERLCICETCLETESGREWLDTVREFERWGDEYGAAVGSYFEHTSLTASMTGGTYRGVVPPRLTAALYVDGSLQGVFPARFEGSPYTVRDFAEVVGRIAPPELVPDVVDSPG
jgi:hypothetical protein